ncbi:ribonuclease III [Nitrosophilus labii]|uniref:ribonuclease III n=1 Tax=Nitrosophilus labii TaxID=2706014 RepID=UPI001657201D|nr:ribonuclease III [Nitrosophilus labii]
MQQSLRKFEERLGYTFKNRNLLIEALTHKSYKKPYNNERLEFLGDAVLDLVIGEYLFFKFPNANEGELSKMRASLVNEDGFARLANELELGKYIFISAAEENNNGRNKPSLLSNAFEAVMGAIYLESGLDEVKKITLKLLEKIYPKIDLNTLFKDYKTTLQELTQAKYGTTPEYKLISSYGPDHKKEFEVAVLLHGEMLSSAKGKSKKAAQQEAAKKALEILKKSDKL